MITYNDTFLGLINELSNSKYEFRLTGSRVTDRARKESDYDFIVEYSAEVVEYLNSLSSAFNLKYATSTVINGVVVEPNCFDMNTHNVYKYTS